MKRLLSIFVFGLFAVTASALDVSLSVPPTVRSGVEYYPYASSTIYSDGDPYVSGTIYIYKNGYVIAENSDSNWYWCNVSTSASVVDNVTQNTIIEYRAEINSNSAWDYFAEQYGYVEITADSAAPTISLTIGNVTCTGGNSGYMSVDSGTTLNFSTSASDSDGNYANTTVWGYFNGVGQGVIQSTGASSTNFQYTVSSIGVWRFECRAIDTMGVQSGMATITVNTSAHPASATLHAFSSSVRLGESINFTVYGSSASGLNEIGLERCDAYGNTIANLGSMSTGATSASQTFSWTPTEAGTYYFSGYAYNVNRTHSHRTGANSVEVYLGDPPVAAITVDGHSHGQTIVWYDGSPPPVVTVRYKATDADGNLSGIRPQTWAQWEETGYDSDGNPYTYWVWHFDNNNWQFIGQSGGSGEVTKTITLDHATDWYFWTDATDAVGQYASTGDWENGFRLTVVRQPSYPTLTVQYLDLSGNVLSPRGDGLIHVDKGASIRVHFNATAPSNNINRLYWRVRKPGNAAGAAPSPEWIWHGWGWGDEWAVYSNTTWTTEPMLLAESGVWDFWHHATVPGAGPYSGDGNGSGWSSVHQPDILVNSRPGVALHINNVSTGGGSTNSLTANNGDVLNFSTFASDVDGNYQRTRILASLNGGAWTEVRDTAQISDTFQFTLSGVGNWTFRCWSVDSYGEESPTATINVTSATRPVVTISPQTLQVVEVGGSIVFTSQASDADGGLNAHNFDWRDPNGVWVWNGGTGLSTNSHRESYFANTTSSNRSIVVTGLQAGNYRIRWSIRDETTHWISSDEVTLRVTDRFTDTDSDGLPDLIEFKLGLNPDVADLPAYHIWQYQYDANGQLKSGPGKTYHYDAEGNVQTTSP